MDACTASTLRWILVVIVLLMAAMGLWSAAESYACRDAADTKACTRRSFSIVAGALAAGLFFTTLIITHQGRQTELLSTTDLVQNLA